MVGHGDGEGLVGLHPGPVDVDGRPGDGVVRDDVQRHARDDEDPEEGPEERGLHSPALLGPGDPVGEPPDDGHRPEDVDGVGDGLPPQDRARVDHRRASLTPRSGGPGRRRRPRPRSVDVQSETTRWPPEAAGPGAGRLSPGPGTGAGTASRAARASCQAWWTEQTSTPQGPPASTQRSGSIGALDRLDDVQHRGGGGGRGQAVAAGRAGPRGDQAGPHHGAHHLGDEGRGGAHLGGQGPSRRGARGRRPGRGGPAGPGRSCASVRVASRATLAHLGCACPGRELRRSLGPIGSGHGGAPGRRGRPPLGGGVLPPRLRVRRRSPPRGRLFDPDLLPGLVAWEAGHRVGALAFVEEAGRGRGGAAGRRSARAGAPARPCCAALEALGRSRGWERLRLCTTNDNTAGAALLPAARLGPGGPAPRRRGARPGS